MDELLTAIGEELIMEQDTVEYTKNADNPIKCEEALLLNPFAKNINQIEILSWKLNVTQLL